MRSITLKEYVSASVCVWQTSTLCFYFCASFSTIYLFFFSLLPTKLENYPAASIYIASIFNLKKKKKWRTFVNGDFNSPFSSAWRCRDRELNEQTNHLRATLVVKISRMKDKLNDRYPYLDLHRYFAFCVLFINFEVLVLAFALTLVLSVACTRIASGDRILVHSMQYLDLSCSIHMYCNSDTNLLALL